ncbi:hypothetical protein CH330_04115 [candidate division WOR-3 bacterium JGI_Cruoil_03_51_56]|uniref:DUF503 domain-containing protein n=1 Tax=candidate division WOR-3 bacterium JGI_Cruoil_03_51_56 TaxID=1973747 RepID=A0A235BUT0_UNCW3|nr:MAG: hypothetical protein CH330_04115 [candidate division WOR-3 bacterium JGI_Cruoil_03_51_56]
MSVGLLLLDCFVNQSRSLKDKRRIIKSMTERLRRNFNIAICEVEYQNQWQRARLAIVLVNTRWSMAQRTISRILGFFERDRRIELLNAETQKLY